MTSCNLAGTSRSATGGAQTAAKAVANSAGLPVQSRASDSQGDASRKETLGWSDRRALGWLLLDVYRFTEAVEQLELALRQQPGDVLALTICLRLTPTRGVVRTPSPPPKKARTMAAEQTAESTSV